MNNDFTYTFTSPQPVEDIFETLQDVRKWWFGVYDETITGSSNKAGDEFTFIAGGGVHNTTQKMIELIPNKKIAWQVTAANLSFLKKPEEWKNTTFKFELTKEGNNTRVTFTHVGLQPDIECYDACSGGWTQYLKRLEQKLK